MSTLRDVEYAVELLMKNGLKKKSNHSYAVYFKLSNKNFRFKLECS